MSKTTFHRMLMTGALAVAAIANTGGAFAQERAICYNCPPEWADWGSQLRAIRSTLGIQVPPDNKNSGQSIAALITEKNNPYCGPRFQDNRLSCVLT